MDTCSIVDVVCSATEGSGSIVDPAWPATVGTVTRDDKSSGEWTCRNVTWCGAGKFPYFEAAYTAGHGLCLHTCILLPLKQLYCNEIIETSVCVFAWGGWGDEGLTSIQSMPLSQHYGNTHSGFPKNKHLRILFITIALHERQS